MALQFVTLIAPEGSNFRNITPGKSYPASVIDPENLINLGRMFEITNDVNWLIKVNEHQCSVITGKSWIVKE